jgi:hypothetical protein
MYDAPSGFVQFAAEIAFIDCAGDDPAGTLASLRPDVQGVLLHATEPAPVQMARALRTCHDLRSIHIVTAAGCGELRFAGGVLSASNLADFASELALLGRAMAPAGSVALWSRGTAPGSCGSDFLGMLARTTHVSQVHEVDATQPELLLLIGGRPTRPHYAEDGLAIFVLPRRASDVVLLASAPRPPFGGDAGVRRQAASLTVRRMVFRDATQTHEIALDHPALATGWHGSDPHGTSLQRPLSGRAVLPVATGEQPAVLEVWVGHDASPPTPGPTTDPGNTPPPHAAPAAAAPPSNPWQADAYAALPGLHDDDDDDGDALGPATGIWNMALIGLAVWLATFVAAEWLFGTGF